MPLFVTGKDLTFFQKTNKEYYKLMFTQITVFKPSKEEFNRTYGENLAQTLNEAYSIEAFIPKLKEFESEASKFGLSETRTLRVIFSKDLLEERNLEFPTFGDQLQIQNLRYKIIATSPIDYESNNQIPLSWVVDTVQIKYENPANETTVWKEY
jgi:hypothetical protein